MLNADKFKQNIIHLVKARFSVVYIKTWEEQRLMDVFQAIVDDENSFNEARSFYQWSVIDGMSKNGEVIEPDIKKSLHALEYIYQVDEKAIFLLKDVYADLRKSKTNMCDQAIIRQIKDIIQRFKLSQNAKTLFICGHDTFIPDELSKEISIVDFDLPNEDEIKAMYQKFMQDNSVNEKLSFDLSDQELNEFCRASSGLTLHEAENALALSMVKDGKLEGSDLASILEEKKQIIKRTGVLEYLEMNLNMDDIGGLDNLKKWIYKRTGSWGAEAKKYNLPSPKGLLVTGVPGCGKSLTAKALSSHWRLPLLRFDIGSVFGPYVGNSEANMRQVMKTAEAIAPCVLWIDEIEKGFSGIGGSGDSGTTTRVFGSFLSWMQEKEKFVFVMATANKIDALPPELMRKGRFDEIFFVDLPSVAERKAIFNVHLKRNLTNPDIMGDVVINDEFVDNLVELSEGYTGAEIEQAVISALFEAFSERRELKVSDFEKSISDTVPLAVTQFENIAILRNWAQVRAVSATLPDSENETEIEAERESNEGVAESNKASQEVNDAIDSETKG